MAIGEVLLEAGVKSVLVIDDGYDEIPFPNDMVEVDDLFANFFDDLTEDDEARILTEFADFNPAESDILKRRPEFLSWLWNVRETFRPDLCSALFGPYSDNLEKDLKYLDELTGLIGDDTVTVVKCGRDFKSAANDADLIIIDRFLGAAQKKEDEEGSTEKLLEVLDSRRDKPPLIVLMSRRDSSAEATDAFRERAQVFASGFRFLDKRRMSIPGQLEHVFSSLARQRETYMALSGFVRAWETGLGDAAKRTIALFRGLDAEDWAHTQDLLLQGENQSLASYILDLSDRVLLHELEGDADVISKATLLTGLSSEFFPPSTASGQKDTLAIVERTQIINQVRRKSSQNDFCPVIFGDILTSIQKEKTTAVEPFKDPNVDALLVVTPACDLMRKGGAKRVVAIAGKYKELSHLTYDPLASGARTPVFKKQDGKRVSIEWDKNHIEAIPIANLKTLLEGATPDWQIAGTLREVEATSIQQYWTGHMSRVADFPTMTATFYVNVRIAYPDSEDGFTQINLDGNDVFQAVCYVGRTDEKKIIRIPLSRDIEHAYLKALNDIDIASVHERSRSIFEVARQSSSIARLFAQGIQMEEFTRAKKELFASPGEKSSKIGYVIHNIIAEEAFAKAPARRTAGLVFEIHDFPTD